MDIARRIPSAEKKVRYMEHDVCRALIDYANRRPWASLVNCFSKMKKLFNAYARQIAERDYGDYEKMNWANRWDAYCWLEETPDLTLRKIYLQAQKMVDEYMDTERR